MAVSRVAWLRAQPTISVADAFSRKTRASEELTKPRPTSATREKGSGSLTVCRPPLPQAPP